MTRPKKWYENIRLTGGGKRSHRIWNMLVMVVMMFLACLVIGILLHLLIDVFSNDTMSGMRL